MARLKGVGGASFQHAQLRLEEVCVSCNRELAKMVTLTVEKLGKIEAPES